MGKKQRNRLVSQDLESGESTYILEDIEDSAPQAEAPKQEPKAEEAKVQFDGWYALRSGVIPAIHKKEILKADFKGRKVPMVATIAEFDEALKKYGVQLV